MIQRGLLLFALMFCLGCWSKEWDEPGKIQIDKRPTQATIPAGFQRTWAATQVVLSKFPIEKKDVDSTTGRAYIVTNWIRGHSDVLYHGYDVNRVPYVIRYKLYVYLTGNQSGGTKVVIKNSEQYLDDIISSGVDVAGNLQTWVKTESSTLKENALLEQIQKLVKDPKFRGEGELP